jgi:hypothetical protein
MGRLKDATPQISVRLYKTISRATVDGKTAVSARYEGKDPYIDLTPFLNMGSSVVTSKSVREPAGAFSITFSDRPQQSVEVAGMQLPSAALESVYGLVEPMDMIEIRMWSGLGSAPLKLPIKMRGFVGSVDRTQTMTEGGTPVRTVVISGHDYGKIWQMIQVLYLNAYMKGKPLLTTFGLSEIFGLSAKNIEKSSDLIRNIVEKIINVHIDEFMPKNSPMPRKLETGESISVKHGVINASYQSAQGSIYDIMKLYGDVGIWNELYTEDREDGVYCVYRATPAMGLDGKLIQDDSPLPIYVAALDEDITALATNRSDENVANFYWVSSIRADLNDELFRKTASITQTDPTAVISDYPNAAEKYYGIRAMYGETQMGGDEIINLTTGQDEKGRDKRQGQMEDWITNRRRIMMEMNRDNVVLERGTIKLKGGPMRPDAAEPMKAGDYAKVRMGTVEFIAYAVQVTDEFIPFQSYTTEISFERGTGFVERIKKGGGTQSPWLAEQAQR